MLSNLRPARVGWAGLGAELRRSVRTLRRRPWFAGAVVTTLALGIGATTLAFTLVDTVLLRPLPYPASEELVDVSRLNAEWFGPRPNAADAGGIFATPTATFLDWERSTTSLSSLGAYAWTARTFTGDGEPERITGSAATAGLFRALAVPAAVGRYLSPADDEIGAEPAVVLSHGLWVRRYASDPDIAGRTVRLGGVPATIVGVMPPGFAFPDEETEFWISLGVENRTDETRNAGWLHGLGRLAPGSTLERARAELVDVQTRLGEIHAEEARFIAVAFSRHEMVVAPLRGGLILLLGAAAVVLLVACANVANLLLTRATERRRELALHTALGASGRQLTFLLLSESVLLSALGGLAGIALAAFLVEPLVHAFPMDLPRAAEIRIDARAVTAGLLVSLASGVFLGVLPTMRTLRVDLEGVLRDGGSRTVGGGASSTSHALLVVAEVALSVLLLSTSGLLVQSYVNQAHQDRGFSVEGVSLARVTLPETDFDSRASIRTFYTRLTNELASLPGIVDVAVASQMPYSSCCSSPPASVRTADGIVQASLQVSYVSPAYFSAMGIPIVAGRGLLETDDEPGAPVTVVSRALADRFWPGESALGKQLQRDTGGQTPWLEVVGVADDVRYEFGSPPAAEYYEAFAQHPLPDQTVVLRTRPGAPGVPSAARGVIRTLAPDLPIRITSLDDDAAADAAYRSARIGSVVLGVLAAVATILAVLGVYSVLALTVLRRTREIAIRVSLGGARARILLSVLGAGVGMTAIGIGVGLALSVLAAGLLRSGLTGVGTVNPAVMLAVVVTMVATSTAACLVPALRTIRIDPLEAMRRE